MNHQPDTRSTGPPRKKAGPLAKGPANAEVSSPTSTADSSGAGRRCVTGQCVRRDVGLCHCPPPRRGADLWRDGFCHGFLHALRLAARRTNDPETWAMLSRLATECELAGSDD